MARERIPSHARTWLMVLLGQYPNYDSGQLYVNRFLEACDVLTERNEIDSAIPTRKNSIDDVNGVDVKIYKDGKEIPFQVTSSYSNAGNHIRTQEKYPERPHVQMVYVREGDKPLMKSVENLEIEIGRKIKTELKVLQKQNS